MLRTTAKIFCLICITCLPSGCAVRESAPDESERLSQYLESVYQRRLAADPMLATRLGLKQGNDKWSDISIQQMDRETRQNWLDLHQLRTSFDIRRLDQAGRFNYRVFEAELKLRIERASWRYHLTPINQIVGLHLEIPGLLTNHHRIDDSGDARAYINRLQTVGRPIDQFIELFKTRERKGFSLSKSVLPRLIHAAETLVQGDPQDSILLADFTRKVEKLSLGDEDKRALINAASQAIDQDFIPAYRRLIDAFAAHTPVATSDEGVWRLPDGEQFYQFLLRQYTTTDITADQVHTLGLEEVERIHREMESIKNSVGFTGTLKEFFQHLKTAPAFYYPNSDQGRAEYLQLARTIVDRTKSRVTDILPQAPAGDLVVKRIEAYREKSAPIGFYGAGSADGEVPGTVYLGMYDMESLGSFDLPALLFHEGIPGHHLQSAVMQAQTHIPSLRKYYVWWSNTAFTEGWALYGEYLARELGLYDTPYADFGRLAGELWRACRLVVDSGIHAKRWSRQQAVAYLNENTASSLENNERAVDRYLAVPGQATAFKIGMMKILALRERARSQLGDRFDLREFHAIVLRNGPVPLDLLEQEIAEWIGDN
ncbi:DUF885 domain-containing protein [Exilibacterium tricleocarpae]|uniref:DUF885 domain-containing protein n=1 Tax=Exilibacterium tricleocarpae TaxID=2591008 RepID=A0A545TZJ4_9GAMM|nr:DUF885 domain-containing protein [Exilibacterium tricleocarpae]TQV82627.1 DUF885 domain-containing protein [Exilibacterium tricleocarpae]